MNKHLDIAEYCMTDTIPENIHIKFPKLEEKAQAKKLKADGDA